MACCAASSRESLVFRSSILRPDPSARRSTDLHVQLRVVDVSEKEDRKGRPHGLNTGACKPPCRALMPCRLF